MQFLAIQLFAAQQNGTRTNTHCPKILIELFKQYFTFGKFSTRISHGCLYLISVFTGLTTNEQSRRTKLLNEKNEIANITVSVLNVMNSTYNLDIVTRHNRIIVLCSSYLVRLIDAGPQIPQSHGIYLNDSFNLVEQ